jgi:L-2-hydroxycarboxylate dehydrogenase (NAD+)
MTDRKFFTADQLEEVSTALFQAASLPLEHARIIAADLVRANLRGVDSHGVSRIPMYLERLRRGLVNPNPNIRVKRVAGSVGEIDADNGMGFIASHRAIDEGIAIAKEQGIGLVGVHRSTHFGMGALFALQAIEAGYISLIFTNSSPAIPMWGGRTTFLGASPIAAGIPGGKYPPFVMDMAMTVIARGKIRLAAMRGEPIPAGLALDSEGYPTTDAEKAFAGVCLPFGGVKGSVLATLMDLMSGVFTGAKYGGDVNSLYFDHTEPQNVGHLFFLIRPDLFMSMTDFEARMDEFSRRIAELPKAAGFDEILMPGEPERRREIERRKSGIPLSDNVVADLAAEAERVSVSMPQGADQEFGNAA